MTWPRPWQFGQVRSMEKKPWAARTRPTPAQVGQVFGLVPGLAPLPVHSSHWIVVGSSYGNGNHLAIQVPTR